MTTKYDLGTTLFGDDKPPYHVQSMAERALIPRNGLTAVSTFSGCGGSSLGLKTAGFEIPYACEFTPMGADTYRANWPETYVEQKDIRDVTGAEILSVAGKDVGELDLFEGSPPCSSFSAAATTRPGGSYEETIGKVKSYSEGIRQRTDDLFDEWLRLIEEIQPKAIIAENVAGLAQPGPPAEYLGSILSRLHGLGYNVHADIFSSLWVGAATRRMRLVIMGVRKDVSDVPRPRLAGDGHTVREALETMPGKNPADELGESWSDGTGVWSHNGEPMRRYQVADDWDKTPQGGKGVDHFSLMKAHWDRPMPTLTATIKSAGAYGVMHPTECRRFTPTELKWISGFPLDFKLTGTPTNRWERLGRAVTPPLYEELGGRLAKVLLKAGE